MCSVFLFPLSFVSCVRPQVTYGSTATISQLSTSFSKASFVARDQDEQVDLDDPDFWKKAIGLVEQAVPEEGKDDEVGFPR